MNVVLIAGSEITSDKAERITDNTQVSMIM